MGMSIYWILSACHQSAKCMPSVCQVHAISLPSACLQSTKKCMLSVYQVHGSQELSEVELATSDFKRESCNTAEFNSEHPVSLHIGVALTLLSEMLQQGEF